LGTERDGERRHSALKRVKGRASAKTTTRQDTVYRSDEKAATRTKQERKARGDRDHEIGEKSGNRRSPFNKEEFEADGDEAG